MHKCKVCNGTGKHPVEKDYDKYNYDRCIKKGIKHCKACYATICSHNKIHKSCPACNGKGEFETGEIHYAEIQWGNVDGWCLMGKDEEDVRENIRNSIDITDEKMEEIVQKAKQLKPDSGEYAEVDEDGYGFIRVEITGEEISNLPEFQGW